MNLIKLIATYLMDLTENVRSAMRSWWSDFRLSAGGLLKVCLIDVPVALLLLYNYPFIAAGATAAWFGFSSRSPRPLEGVLVSVGTFAMAVFLINTVAELALLLVLLAVWDCRKNFFQSWWYKNTMPNEDGSPIMNPNSFGNRILLALS